MKYRISSRDIGADISLVRTRSSKLNVAFNAPSGRPNGNENLNNII
jgi:hypothetical protein